MAKYFKYKLGNLNGLKRRPDKGGGTVPEQDVLDGILQAMRELEQVCGVLFSPQIGSRETLIEVKFVPNFEHRGYYTRGKIVLNSYIGSTSDDNKWHGKLQVYKIMSHELGHWLGLGHSKDKKSFMHSNANGSWIDPEVSWLQKKYGIPNFLQANESVRLSMKDMSRLLKKRYKTKEEQQEVIATVIRTLEVLQR